MSMKSRLFASVAAPLVSLPLMIQPLAAMPLKAAIETSPVPGVIQVQQQIIVPPGGEEGQRPRGQGGRQDGGGQGEGGGAQRERAPAEAQQQSEQPRRQREAQPEAAPRQAPAAEAPAQERPRRQQQDAGQSQSGQGQGENQPRRDRQREQAAPEAEKPATREAQQPQNQQPRNAAPGDAEPQRRNAQDRNAAPTPTEKQAETPTPRPRANDRAATPETAPQNPARRNAEGQGSGEGSGTAQGNRNQPPPAAGQTTQGQTAPAQAAPNTPGQAAPRQAAPGQTAPEQAAPGQAAPSQPPQTEQPRRQTTEGQPAQPPVPGQAPGQQVAPGQQAAPGQPPAAAPASQPPTAQTPQQVERAKELARDPASAKSGEQVVLPVENGAAVLDSAKEAPATPPAGGNAQQPRRQQNQQADQRQLAPPKSDAEAQGGTRATREQQQEFRALAEERGERLDRRPDFDRPQGWDFRDNANRDGGNRRDRDRDGGRVIISIDNQSVVRHDDSRRFYEDGREPAYERLRDGRVREVIERGDGTRIITVRNSYGEIVQRSRVVKGGEEYVLYYSPELMDNRRGRDYVWRDPGLDLPPMRLTVPLDEYIVDTSTEPDRDYYEFLEQPPVERVERVYSLDEVRYSARIRDKVPRIDLDTVTFATGSAEIPMNQASSLRKVADAISKVLDKDPSETFLIEGHTDAVGSDDSNLVLSDQRAESVARVLTDAFGIPPENLTTQGYGERYLKVRTDGPEQDNRRVTIRRITALVKPVASK